MAGGHAAAAIPKQIDPIEHRSPVVRKLAGDTLWHLGPSAGEVDGLLDRLEQASESTSWFVIRPRKGPAWRRSEGDKRRVEAPS